MKRRFRTSVFVCIGCLTGALIAAACAAAPMPLTSPAAPAEDAPFATLSAIQALVQRIRGDNDTLELKEVDPPVEIQAADRVTVDANGRAQLRFEDFLAVELFRDTELQIGEPQLDLQTSGLIRLKEVFGHTRIELRKQVAQRIELDTDYATIKPLRTGSEMVVCHAPGVLTCVAATSGEIEVEGQGKVVTLRGGEATYILADQEPQPAVCADLEAVRQWMDAFRSTGETGDLGSLVASWPQMSCAEATRVALLPPTAVSVTATVPATEAASATASMTGTVAPAPATPYTPTVTGTPPATPPPAFVAGMVLVQAGAYTVGVDSQTPDAYHATARQITLPAFWIDEHEATNEQYQAFIAAIGHPAPASWPGGTYAAGQDNHPAAGLSFADAEAYCAWAGKRLPAEAEWEAAGRGPDAQPPMYPWGDEPTANGQAWQLPREGTYPTGSAAFNRSASGVYDMAGNVWEWVDRPYVPLDEGQQMLRGGRYGLIRDLAYRQPAAGDDPRFAPVAGVRCAADQAGG